MLKLLKYLEIDFDKYENCLKNSINQNFNSQKEILDFLCQDWDLLIFNDYEFCMPLPYVRKFGVKFLLTPLFCQQLGVFGKSNDILVNDLFLIYIRENFNIRYYGFNTANTFSTNLEIRSNYIIPKQNFKTLKKRYFKGRKSTLKKVENLTFLKLNLDENVIQFIKDNTKGLEKKKDLKFFLAYLDFLKLKQYLNLYGVFSNEQLISLALIIKFKEQQNLLGLVNLESEKSKNASSFLVDQLLENSIENFNFNFMGGNSRGTEVFFKSFGSELQLYPVLGNSTKELLLYFFR